MRDCAVPRKKKTTGTHGARGNARSQSMSQRKLADYLGLSPATVSLVINRSVVADSIPAETQERIFAAARKVNYRPNFFARSLRTQRRFNISVIMPEISEGHAGLV